MSQSVLQPLQVIRKQGQNLVDQLEERLRTLIDTGALREGERLPSTRDLAAQLGVNRSVLLKAVRRLEGSGRIRSRVGSGITVLRGFPDGLDSGLWQLRFSAAIDRLPAGENPGPASEGLFADLSRLAPDERFFPLDEFLKILAETLRRQRDLWQYASPLGLTHLRQRIAVRLSQGGLPWSADDILITSGAQQALDLLFRVFVDPGDSVGVESPTYPGAIPLLRLSGAEAVEIPVIPGGGRDLSALASRRLRLLYTMPEHHNPTGESMDETTKRRLLAAALTAGAVVVEDIYELPRQPRLFLRRPRPAPRRVGGILFKGSGSRLSAWLDRRRPFNPARRRGGKTGHGSLYAAAVAGGDGGDARAASRRAGSRKARIRNIGQGRSLERGAWPASARDFAAVGQRARHGVA